MKDLWPEVILAGMLFVGAAFIGGIALGGYHERMEQERFQQCAKTNGLYISDGARCIHAADLPQPFKP